MAELSTADLRAALDFVGEAGGYEDLDSFRWGILPGLQRLVPCDLVGYNEVEPGAGPALVMTHPEPLLEFAGEELARLAHQHPLISVQMNGDRRTYKISDFLSARQFHRLELYEVIYGRIGAEDQIAFGLPGKTVIGIAMNRDRRSFGERDRELLDLLAPHLARAREQILERQRARALIAGLEADLLGRGGAALLVGPGPSLVHAGPRALELLAAYFPERRGGGLPAALAERLDGPDFVNTRVDSARGRLTIRELELDPGEERLLLLEETRPLTADSLAPLGLTPRQAEVLALLASGASVAEVAATLVLSVATVRKHLEHVYARLGVHSRDEAVAVALAVHESAFRPAMRGLEQTRQ